MTAVTPGMCTRTIAAVLDTVFAAHRSAAREEGSVLVGGPLTVWDRVSVVWSV
jgi:hypothetical protein